MVAYPSWVIALLLSTAGSLDAQNHPVAWNKWVAPVVASSGRSGRVESSGSRATADVPLLVGGGIAGGAVGLFGGGFVGYAFSGGGRICGDDSCGLQGGLYGAAIGEVVLLPLGVHLAHGARGNYGYSLLASAAIGALGLGLAGATDSAELLFAIPIGQLISSVLIERATSRPMASDW